MPAPRVVEPRYQQLNVSLSEREAEVLAQLAADQDRSKPAIMRSALAVYQVYMQCPAVQAAYDEAMMGSKLKGELE